VIDVPVLPKTWENISRYVDVVNWIEAISFSGVIPVFVLVMAFVILVAERTQTAMIKEEEKRVKMNEYQKKYYASKKRFNTESEIAESSVSA
jgi:signal transduction histidine kinase